MNEAAVMPRGDAVAEVGEMVVSDGRNRRSAETRRKIIEAAKAIISETSMAPTVVGVAKRADVSVRSVFQHFGDVESLFVTVVDSSREALDLPPQTPTDKPLSARIASVVDNLGHLFDKIVPLRVAAGQFVTNPALTERAVASRLELRQATHKAFAEEFAALSPDAQEGLADAIGSALSLDAWIVLRRQDGLSFERAAAAWRLTLSALLAEAPRTPSASS